MGFTAAVASAFRQYARFAGRARRSEYWWFTLLSSLVLAVASLVDGAPDASRLVEGRPVSSAPMLALFLPSVAVAVRRLHDTDRSGRWWLLGFVPVVGPVVLLVFFLKPGTEGPNRFGASQEPTAGGPSGDQVPEGQRQTA